MNEDEAVYFKGLGVDRQLDYLQSTWGAAPEVSADIVRLPNGKRAVVASCAVLNAILAAELGNPAPAVLTKRLTRGYSLDKHLGELFVLWVHNIKEALATD